MKLRLCFNLRRLVYGSAGPTPVNTVAPVASGTLNQGDTLTTTNGTWSNSPTGYSYQWYQNATSSTTGGTAISGATSSSFVLTSGQIGLYAYCRVVAINANGSNGAFSNVLGLVQGTPGTLDSALSTPILIDRTSGGVIAFDAGIEGDYGVGDTVYLIAKNKAGTVVLTFSNTIDSSEATDTSAGTTGKAAFTGLSGTSLLTTYRWEVYVLKASGLTRGPSSAVVMTGPDDQEPILSAAATPSSITGTTATAGCTTDEACTLYWVLTASSTAPTATQVEAGQDNAGAAAAGSGSQAATVGANVVNVTGGTGGATRNLFYMGKDATGNRSAVLSGGAVNFAAGSVATLVVGNGATGQGVNKSQYINSTSFTATAVAGIGAFVGVKSASAPPTKFLFEETVTSNSGANPIYLGVTDSATDFNSGFSAPGDSAGKLGSSLKVVLGSSGGTTFRNGGSTSVSTTSAIAVGDIFSADCDTTTNTVVYKRKRVSDGAVETVATETLTSQIPTNWRAQVGVENDLVLVTVNFGASTFAITPLTGHTGW